MHEPTYSSNSLNSATEAVKTPPFSIEAEQSVLGGLMLNNEAWIAIAELLTEPDFYLPKHQQIFKAIKSLAEAGHPCDPVTLSEWLERNNLLKAVGEGIYIGFLARNTPSAANIVAYAKIVREHSILRHLIQVGQKISDSGFNTQGHSSQELLDQAEKLVFEIAELGARHQSGFVKLSDIVSKTMQRIEMLSQQEGTVTGIATGFSDFDEKTSGLQRSDLIIIAGRPSMGKTSFAMNIAEHVAVKRQLPVAIFSMEMSDEQLAMRLISSLAKVDLQRVRTGKLRDEDWPLISQALETLSQSPFFIDQTPALSPIELRTRVRRLVREHGELGLVVIDYLQLMQLNDYKENRATEVAEISRSLKSLAKEINVPIVALSQLNRGLEQRTDKRPKMADLRESGSIEQDADLVVFIYRDEVYNDSSSDKGVAEIIIAKQRNGPIGTVRLTFLSNITKFENYLPDSSY
jgi:replicative DNA helicase